MELTLPLTLELACKFGRINHQIVFENQLLTADRGKCNTPPAMANQRAADKTILTVWLPRTLFARLQKAAAKRSETLTQLVTDLITHATEDVELTAEDYRRIADDTEKAAQRLPAARPGRKTRKAS